MYCQVWFVKGRTCKIYCKSTEKKSEPRNSFVSACSSYFNKSALKSPRKIKFFDSKSFKFRKVLSCSDTLYSHYKN